MKEKIKRFFIKLFLFSLILAVLAFLLGLALPENSLPSALPYLFLLFFTVTLLVHWIVLRITELKPARFVNYFMLATFAKLMIYLVAILVYVFTVHDPILPFVLAFFILYIFIKIIYSFR